MPSDGQREQEGDAALATYLWLLNHHHQELAQAAAGSFRERGHFFWARKFADLMRTANGRAKGNQTGADGQTTLEATEHIEASHRKP